MTGVAERADNDPSDDLGRFSIWGRLGWRQLGRGVTYPVTSRCKSLIMNALHTRGGAQLMTERVTLVRAGLEAVWSPETSSQPAEWSRANPAIGQCAVTALILQDELGGELLRAMVGPVSHYWNRLPTGEQLDWTRQQFSNPPIELVGEVRSRQSLLANEETARRYSRLRSSLNDWLVDHV